MFIYYNPNRLGKRVGDCAVRAVSKALNVDWDTAFRLMTEKAFALADMPSSNVVWGEVLRDHGFTRHTIPNTCPDCYTAADFLIDHPDGVYVIGFGNHVATAIVTDRSADLFDAWNSLNEIPLYYWYRGGSR